MWRASQLAHIASHLAGQPGPTSSVDLAHIASHMAGQPDLYACVDLAHIAFQMAGQPHLFPKASFFRSMAGGVPSGATEGSSMGSGAGRSFFIFSGSFFGTPFAPKTLLFARKNQHFEVHFGAQNVVLQGP